MLDGRFISRHLPPMAATPRALEAVYRCGNRQMATRQDAGMLRLFPSCMKGRRSMDLTSLLLFTAAYFAVVILPGPAITALVARVLARGTRGAPAFIAGCATGSLLWVTVAAAGLAAIASTFATLFLAIKYAGAAYLLYLAWKFWTTDVRLMKAAEVALEGQGQLFLAGLAINLGNPKAMAFFLALLPTIVRLDALTLFGAAELGAIVVMIVSVVFSAYAIAAARARRFFTSPSAIRRMNRGSAVTIAGTAILVVSR